jgi:hypothetical protein
MFIDVSKEHAAYVSIEEKGGIIERLQGRKEPGLEYRLNQ